MPLSDSHLIELPRINDQRGSLTFIEGSHHIPFEIARVYYLYGVPAGATRGGHAHRCLQQLMIAVSGSFDVVLDDGCLQRRWHLDRGDRGLYIPPMTWRTLDGFSEATVCMVLASARYDESDYYRDYTAFLEQVGTTR